MLNKFSVDMAACWDLMLFAWHSSCTSCQQLFITHHRFSTFSSQAFSVAGLTVLEISYYFLGAAVSLRWRETPSLQLAHLTAVDELQQVKLSALFLRFARFLWPSVTLEMCTGWTAMASAPEVQAVHLRSKGKVEDFNTFFIHCFNIFIYLLSELSTVEAVWWRVR